MTGFSVLHSTLQSTSLAELGLAFSAVIGYGVAQGRLVGAAGRRRAWAIAAISAVGFCAQSDDWTHGTVWVAFGLVAIGMFAALVSGLSRLLDVNARAAAAGSSDFEFNGGEAAGSASLPRLTPPTRAAHST